MKCKLNIVAAYRKTRLVYQMDNRLYHVDIEEIGDVSRPSMGFKTVNSKTKKFKITQKGDSK